MTRDSRVQPQKPSAPIRCQECPLVWSDAAERWRTYVTSDDPPALLFYCAGCAQDEFGTAGD